MEDLKGVILLVGIGLLLCGCGSKGPNLVPVREEITWDGGPWPKPGTLSIVPAEADAGVPRRPASADFDTEGKFAVTTFTPGDGLLPGKYRIGVNCWEVPMTMANPAPGKNAAPLKYRSPETSGLELTVEAGKSLTGLQLDVPKN